MTNKTIVNFKQSYTGHLFRIRLKLLRLFSMMRFCSSGRLYVISVLTIYISIFSYNVNSRIIRPILYLPIPNGNSESFHYQYRTQVQWNSNTRLYANITKPLENKTIEFCEQRAPILLSSAMKLQNIITSEVTSEIVNDTDVASYQTSENNSYGNFSLLSLFGYVNKLNYTRSINSITSLLNLFYNRGQAITLHLGGSLDNIANDVDKSLFKDLPVEYQNRPLPKHLVAVTFVNGIYHSEVEWKEIVDKISKIFGTEIYPFYYPSSGYWVNDFSRAGYARFIRPSHHPQVLALVHHLRNALSKLSPRGRVLHLAHSGGAILTYLAAKNHLNKEEKDRIDIVTFGGGRSITNKYFGGYVINYYATNDLVSLIDGRAASLKAKIVFNNSSVEVKYKHNTSFVFLRAMANDLLLDHAMNGPTYHVALVREAIALQDRIMAIQLAEAKEKDRMRMVRKSIAKFTGFHHFWKRPYLSVRLNIKPYYFDSLSSETKVYMRKIRKTFSKATGLHHFWRGF